ncbi:ATP-dependent helicase HrpB [Akkermansiaceae bacterium]|nr:ATP-dependent helicase HrpB [Akkermansiaceae bacterium]
MPLPVESIHSDLVAPFEEGKPKRILLKAPTGSGKSTMVPGMLADQYNEGLIVVIQPRRMAARLLAKRVASLRGSRLGDEVGYSVRFDQMRCEKTRILFVTDGIFQNWISRDPKLEGVTCVIFDEFHERRVSSDVSLAKCLNLQESTRADLSVIVMSATLDMGDLASYLGEVRQLETTGRTYPVEIEYLTIKPPTNTRKVVKRGPQQEPIWELCHQSARAAINDSSTEAGHILIFLPGAYEIRKTIDLLESDSSFRHCEICPLYSSLPPKLQDKAVAPSERQKIIVSTNVAETSLTIDGVRTVIDSGVARIAEFDPSRGIETLHIKTISQAAADQRAGRAGRTAPGKCFRLWSHTSHARRAVFETPEILRSDIAELTLKLLCDGEKIEDFRWIDAPQPEAVINARNVLSFLDAIDEFGDPTELGKQMAKFPLPPRFARLLFAGEEEGCLAEASFIAAAIQGDSLFAKKKGLIGRADYIYEGDSSDFDGEYRAYESAEAMDFHPKRCGDAGIHAKASRECQLALKQIHQYVGNSEFFQNEKPPHELRVRFSSRKDAILKAAVKAFGDRIGRRLSTASLASKLCNGRRGLLDTASAGTHAELFIPTEMTEVEGREVVTYFNRCFSLDIEFIKASFSDQITILEDVEFEPMARKVVHKTVTQFKGLTIKEEAGGQPNPELASAILAKKIVDGELIINAWNQDVDNWLARLASLSEAMPELELPEFTEEDKFLVLEQFCQGATSYKEIKNKEILPTIKGWLSSMQMMSLNSYAPLEIKLENGSNAKVYYQSGTPPWIAKRAQHLFGVQQTPTIANGQIKLNVHICAPNNRPWQITNDLEGFWKSGFEQMRKDLGGRYPKHQWTLP